MQSLRAIASRATTSLKLPQFGSDVFQQVFTSPFRPQPAHAYRNGGFYLLRLQRLIQPGAFYLTSPMSSSRDLVRISPVVTLLPRRQKVWLHVAPPMPIAPWQSDSLLVFSITDDEGTQNAAKLHFIVSEVEEGWHEVTIEWDPDMGPTGFLSLWRGDQPVRGQLCDSKGPIQGMEGWTGAPGGRPDSHTTRGVLHTTSSRAYTLLRQIIQRDKTSAETTIPRTLADPPTPSTETWDSQLISNYLARLPESIRKPIEEARSPVLRAALLLHIPALYHAHHLVAPPFNLITTLRPGSSRVRALPHTQCATPAETLPIHWVTPANTVHRSHLIRATSPLLHQHELDLEYGMIPVDRYAGRLARGALTRAKRTGVMLSSARLILMRGLRQTLRGGKWRATWLTWRHQQNLATFPGVMSIVAVDRRSHPPSGMAPLKKADPYATAIQLGHQRGEGDGSKEGRGVVPWGQQVFWPIEEEPYPALVALPEVIDGLHVFPQEVPMLLALHAGRLPDRGLLPDALHNALAALDGDGEKQSRACRFVRDFFVRRHMTRLRPGEAFWRGTGEARRDGHHFRRIPFHHSLFPLHINLIDSIEDLGANLEAWVSLDQVTMDLAVASGPEGEYEHVRLMLKLDGRVPSSSPPVGPLLGFRLEHELSEAGYQLVLKSGAYSFGAWPRTRATMQQWYHPLDRIMAP